MKNRHCARTAALYIQRFFLLPQIFSGCSIESQHLLLSTHCNCEVNIVTGLWNLILHAFSFTRT